MAIRLSPSIAAAAGRLSRASGVSVAEIAKFLWYKALIGGPFSPAPHEVVNALECWLKNPGRFRALVAEPRF